MGSKIATSVLCSPPIVRGSILLVNLVTGQRDRKIEQLKENSKALASPSNFRDGEFGVEGVYY